ncbi:hypothetical protein FA15DRAFT_675321 [Coprinopsis marcescibilis]|uniref:Uncharacterized protein n=1 Tax=Coprinopsis marcescibilis TaxID=230819 RepID=A0A5C3KEC8_COPMA|nr:hypothetical protein FA15DRAFT_675321 [Coprinopsis marcescibilis]
MVQLSSAHVFTVGVLAVATLAKCAAIPPPAASIATRAFGDSDLEDLSTRDILDLLPRSDVEALFGRSYDEVAALEAREVLEEIEARGIKKFFKNLWRKAKGVVKSFLPFRRDLSDVDGVESREIQDDLMDLFERDAESAELYERDLFDALDEAIFERSFWDDAESVYERDEEFEAREFDLDLMD